jgi:hypothetical protein
MRKSQAETELAGWVEKGPIDLTKPVLKADYDPTAWYAEPLVLRREWHVDDDFYSETQGKEILTLCILWDASQMRFANVDGDRLWVATHTQYFLNLSDVAAMIGANVRGMQQYKLPEPDVSVGGKRGWHHDSITDWIGTRRKANQRQAVADILPGWSHEPS